VRACAAYYLAQANRCLGWIQGRREEALWALGDALKDRKRAVRVAAIDALALLRKHSLPDVETILVEALHSRDPMTRLRAAEALRSIKCTDKDVVQRLRRAADDPCEQVRRVARSVLGTVLCERYVDRERRTYS
jgi:HEAT repeat protein